MALKEELARTVAAIFAQQWTDRDGRIVPLPEQIKLGNDAVLLDGTVLYADMADSTQLVDTKTARFAAEVYKAYLACAARILKDEGGAITAYDGDRIMAVFLGDLKNTTAARAALRINGAVLDIINPALANQYAGANYRVAHHIGVDTSSLLVSRVGVRNDNDLVWVGMAANYAAKLCAIREINTVFITDEVFQRLHEGSKFGGNPKQLMWTERKWSQMNDKRVYSSAWKWAP